MIKSKLSILLPCYNEEISIKKTVDEICSLKILKDKYNNFVIYIINDGSTDNSWNIIKELSKKNLRVKGFNLNKNYGKDLAISSCLKLINSEIYLIMDVDGEHPVDKITDMLNNFDKKVIQIGVRINNKNFIKKLLSKFYKLFLELSTGSKIPANSTDFVIFSDSIYSKLRSNFSNITYFKSVFFFLGEKIQLFEFESKKNLLKKRSSFNFFTLINIFFTTITFYSSRLLKIAQIITLSLIFLALLELFIDNPIMLRLVYLVYKLSLFSFFLIIFIYLKNLYEIVQLKKTKVVSDFV